MKTIFTLFLILLAISLAIYFFNKKSRTYNPPVNQTENKVSKGDVGSEAGLSSDSQIINSDSFKNINMKLKSSAFENNRYIPSKYTCDGANINPPLSIIGVPKETKSLTLIVDDPDAPSGDWIHWIIFNISPNTKEISEGKVPANSIEGKTDFKNPGYGGPCPPGGIHHYLFKLYALDVTLSLDAFADKKMVEEAMNGHIIAQDFLVGLYERK